MLNLSLRKRQGQETEGLFADLKSRAALTLPATHSATDGRRPAAAFGLTAGFSASTVL
jgi:hypothetical protein